METTVPAPMQMFADFKSDKVVGVLLILASGLSVVSGIVVLWIGSVLLEAIRAADDSAGANHAKVQSTAGSILTPPVEPALIPLVCLILTFAVLQALAGFWIYRSSRKGFILALITAVFCIFGGSFRMMIGIATGLYVILRLWGNVGPRAI